MDNTMAQQNDYVENVIESTAAPERTFTQQELNRKIGEVRHEAVETYKRKQAAQQQAQQEQSSYQHPISSGLSEEQIRHYAADEFAKKREEYLAKAKEDADRADAERVVKLYKEKMSVGKDKYNDFDQVTSAIDMRYYPNVVAMLAEHIDNAPDVLYELSKSPSRLLQLQQLYDHKASDSIYEMKRLSSSIRSNEKSQNVKVAKEPLSHQRASSITTDSGTAMPRASDYRSRKTHKG